jgi:hypothetical protein
MTLDQIVRIVIKDSPRRRSSVGRPCEDGALNAVEEGGEKGKEKKREGKGREERIEKRREEKREEKGRGERGEGKRREKRREEKREEKGREERMEEERREKGIGEKRRVEIDSKAFSRWCINNRITGYLDFVRRPKSKMTRNITFRKLDLLPSSSGRGDTHSVVPLRKS